MAETPESLEGWGLGKRKDPGETSDVGFKGRAAESLSRSMIEGSAPRVDVGLGWIMYSGASLF